MLSVFDVVVLAIFSLVRPPAVDVQDHAEQHRLVTLAHDITLAAEMHDGAPFLGPQRKEALALALVAIAFHESAFDARVADCRITGDRLPHQRAHEGRSVSLWQLMGSRSWFGHKRREVCRNQPLAAYLAVKVLRLYSQSSYGGFFRGYASGNGGLYTPAASKRCKTWERLAREAGLKGATCWGRGAISSAATD